MENYVGLAEVFPVLLLHQQRPLSREPKESNL